ncbi:deoxynucleotidyltransferase terminal-interacting protein 2 isoform X2 [Thalassophryne amazonica]|uniref:deoxynucleotidyltransferase terminal-interacting protein 2 isoform X2 n=1 Tax=Thalassophryne amazonica TaxID=390379 RepID=UPI001471C665|nr:deoxynucleotidyltransferase terminal-interacting protein 2 isoform X2 [Thalassophryne amazonica]
MVATRRRVCVSSTKTDTDQTSAVQATPSTGRRTRSTTKGAGSLTLNAVVDTRIQLEKREENPSASPLSPPCSVKRCTRSSKLHSPEQPSTPVGPTHEAEMSDQESCSSLASDIQTPATCRRGKRRRWPSATIQDDETSEVESCSSSVSASKIHPSVRRSTRRKKISECSDMIHVEGGDGNAGAVEETESQRASRSPRRSVRARLSAKQYIEESEVSDADSCTSSVPEADIPGPNTRRTTRSRAQPIPKSQDEASESSSQAGRRSRRISRMAAAATVDYSESQSCDSDGFESGPSKISHRRGKTKSKAADSDSELTAVHSPLSEDALSGSGVGSGKKSLTVSSTRLASKALKVIQERSDSSGAQEQEFGNETSVAGVGVLNDSVFESTVITADADCTLMEEEEKSQSAEEKITVIHPAQMTVDTTQTEREEEFSEDHSHVSASPSAADSSRKKGQTADEPAVLVRDQQEEPSAGNQEGDTSDMAVMQETDTSLELINLPSCQLVRETVCDMDVNSESAMGGHPCVAEETLGGDTVVEALPSGEEETEVCMSDRADEQVGGSSDGSLPLTGSRDVHSESTDKTSNRQHRVTVDSTSEPQRDSVAQNTTSAGLLESSEDEDDSDSAEEEDGEESEEEDCGYTETERERPPRKREAAAASVAGLFMIDTRPGHEADERYYKDAPGQEEEVAAGTKEEESEQDEEFIDEEGDDDEDEDAQILFSGRNPQVKELSSRIDPGLRMKELGGLYITFDGSKSKPASSSLKKLKEKMIQDEVMKKSVIGPDFEKKDAVPPYSESRKALKLKRRVEREKTTGESWFNMKAPELTQELKGDLQVLKMRGSLDPKRFYKKNDREGFPKYFQVGTVMDNAADFYHSRIPKKQRKRTMMEELLADAEFRQKKQQKEVSADYGRESSRASWKKEEE